MIRQRKLIVNDKVIILYKKKTGFIEKPAFFLRYSTVLINETQHEVPIFIMENEEISGLDCFWILERELKSKDDVQKLQYKIIELQVDVLAISLRYDYSIPIKINDKEIIKMAQDKADSMKALTEKLGFDPRDESWIENDMADNNRERNWFIFERQNSILLANKWQDIAEMFNARYNESISPEEAKNLHKKRQRFLLGAFHTRMSGNSDRNDWKKSAKEFEKYHLNIENNMLTWSLKHINHFPLVKVIQPIKFMPGPYFHQCIEQIPKVFVDTTLSQIRSGVVLRVIGYDSETNYIRLDFTEDIRKLVKGEESKDIKVWIKDEADYDFWVMPQNINTHLKFLEPIA